MALTDILRKKIVKVDNNDMDWRQYVYDHLYLIKQTRHIKLIDNTDMYRYRYRPEAYFASINLPRKYVWITMLINNIEQKTDFKDKQYLFICDTATIDNLYSQYAVYKHNVSSL